MPMNMTAEQAEWFHRMRGEWLTVMQPLDGYRPSPLFAPLPTLSAELLENCKVVPDRYAGLQLIPKGGKVAELGTQEGRFADHIWNVCQPTELHLFDLDFSPLTVRQDTNLGAVATLHTGDSSENLAKFPQDYFDWIYIDGDHSYNGAKRDMEVAKTRVKPGGLLVFNDFVLWSPVECSEYGVPYAVTELATNEGFEFVYFALHFLMYCDVALRRPLTNR